MVVFFPLYRCHLYYFSDALESFDNSTVSEDHSSINMSDGKL